MPPRDDQHVQKARLNEEFAKGLDRTLATAEMWSVVVIFYAALHYVQSYFVTVGASEDSYNHEKREAQIARDPKLKFILGPYKFLFKMSHTARYRCVHFATEHPDPYGQAEKLLSAIKAQVDRAKEP
jgi:hypothetical protein